MAVGRGHLTGALSKEFWAPRGRGMNAQPHSSHMPFCFWDLPSAKHSWEPGGRGALWGTERGKAWVGDKQGSSTVTWLVVTVSLLT